MGKTILSFGHGYCARALTPYLRAQGWRVIATTRSAHKAQAIAQTGAEPLIWPGTDMRPAIKEADHMLVSAAPDKDGDPVLAALGDQIQSSRFDWVGYLSTTGVYGDNKGNWVDENTPLLAGGQRGQRRIAAEAHWRAMDLPLHIFRLAGIYGPGRGPFSKVRKGTARRIIKPGQVFSRIHVDDITQVLAASIKAPNPGRIYNVCDDEPAPPQDVIAYAATLLDLPMPPEIAFEDAQMTPMARSFYGESKCVRNDRIKNELGVRLLYPDYRAGLDALRAAMP